jgi:hypothetical protein
MIRFYKFMEHLFWRMLCVRPDLKIFGSYAIACWWYNVSGKIASYFHCKTCDRCKS